MSLTLRGIKQSALTHGELDNNFLWLKSRDIVDATLAGTNLVLTKDDTTTFNVDLSAISGGNGGNMWHVPYGYTLTVQDNFQSFIYGDLYIEGTVDLQTNAQLVVLNGNIHISGGSIVGSGTTEVVQLPDFDTKISGLTYTADTLTIYQNDGSTYSTTIVSSTDITVTGGTYNPTTGTATFYDNNGGNFDVNGFLTGYTDVKVSGLTYSGDTLTLTQTDGSYFDVTINSSTPFTGNTSGDCITDLYVTNLNSCSPLHIQPGNNGDVLIGENGGINVGIGTSTPSEKLEVNGKTKTSTLQISSGSTANYVLTSIDTLGNTTWKPKVYSTGNIIEERWNIPNFAGTVLTNGTPTPTNRGGWILDLGDTSKWSKSGCTGPVITYRVVSYNTGGATGSTCDLFNRTGSSQISGSDITINSTSTTNIQSVTINQSNFPSTPSLVIVRHSNGGLGTNNMLLAEIVATWTVI